MIATTSTKRLPAPGYRRRARRPQPGAGSLPVFVIFVTVVANSSVTFVAQDPTDAELEAASLGRVVRVGSNGRVIEMAVELYVARVLAGEGEAGAGEAAQRALAIAIRTFAAANPT